MIRRLGGMALILAGLALTLTACSKRESHKVRIEERQEEGEVRDVPPGEMIVE
ncbi:MAG: hypothetical protein IPM64_14450 [Phycisphaerales bacterium]|nr:hypothetical protein [Phycisphaerales bacterium]